MSAFPGGAPILVDSAGCGAQLKEYGQLLGTQRASDFSKRVLDVHEWLADHLDLLPPATSVRPKIAIQDPCHLRHAQRSHEAVRLVLERYTEAIQLDDEGLCCGAGGAYSTLHPDLASSVRERKISSINRANAEEVASANPGCLLYLQAGGVRVRHPIEIIDTLLTKDV